MVAAYASEQVLEKSLGIRAIGPGDSQGTLVRLCTADHEGVDALGRILRHAKPDPPTHGIAPEMRRAQVENIKHGDDIAHMSGQRIGGGVVGFVTVSMPTSIHADKSVKRFQRVDISGHLPALHFLREPMLKDERRTVTVDFIVD